MSGIVLWYTILKTVLRTLCLSIHLSIYHLSICNYLLKLGKEYKQEIDRKGSGRDQ